MENIKTKTLSFLRWINPARLIKKWWKMRGFKKWLLAAVAVVILFFLGNFITSSINKGKPDLKRFQIIEAKKQDISKTITKEGTLRFSGVVDYPTPTSGVITDIWVKNGEQVKIGQRILSLKSTASKEEQLAALNQYLVAKTALETARITKGSNQVSLEKARQSLLTASQSRQDLDDRLATGNRQNQSANRPNQTYTDNEIEAIRSAETQARSSFSIAEKQYANSEAEIKVAEANLNLSWWRYQLTKDAVVTAPIDGQLVNLNILVGDTVSSKDEFLFRIISSDDMSIELKASEAEVLQFEIGQETKFKTAVYTGEEFEGKIIAVDTIGTEVKSDTGYVTEYTVKIQPEITDKKFLSPMTVDTDTVVQNKSEVLTVPNAAVNYGNSKKTVTVVKNGLIHEQEVELGIISDNDTEVISGLLEGDQVLVPKSGKL